MSNPSVAERTGLTAAEICQQYRPGIEARSLLRPDLIPEGFVELLVERALDPDALEFIARWLPKREAVWWGCQCVWQASSQITELDDAALRAAADWVREPNEPHRLAAEAAATAAGTNTAAGTVALAAFSSGGDGSRPNMPGGLSSIRMTAQTIAEAVRMAATQGDAVGIADRKRRFVRLGLDVAQGRNRW